MNAPAKFDAYEVGYDIPAVPVCTGQELTDSLLKQIAPFGATFHLRQEVTAVQQQPAGRFFVETSKGTRFLTKTVFIAGGVGSFQPRTLKVDGLERFFLEHGTEGERRDAEAAILKARRAAV